MSSPAPIEPIFPTEKEDDHMQGSSGEEDEGEGDVILPVDSDDSSEELDEDEEEERRIREGFIVDEEEDEEDNEEERRRRKRRKRRHRKPDDEEEGLEEDDLELLEENTGASFKNRLTRLRRGPNSGSPPAASSSKRKAVVESSEDDLDQDDLDLPKVQDIQRIWDDDRGGGQDEDDMDDMDNFIDYDEDDGGAGAIGEDEREERRKERRRLEKERRKAMAGRPELAGMDASAWAEIFDVFGDGHEYEFALAGDEDVEFDEEQLKPEMKYQDVFEPSEIRARLLTEDDDLIRAQDIPERMQLATSSLSQLSTLSLHKSLTQKDLADAAMWVTMRLSARKTREFFSPEGTQSHLQQSLILAVTYALRSLFIEEFEVPYIWTHKRDYLSHFDPRDVRSRVELLSSSELWRIYSLGQKYRSLVERRSALATSYRRFNIQDEYYENEIEPKIDSVEVVADATEWLTMKYKDKKQDNFEFHFHDDEEQVDTKKRKKPSRISAYEVAKKSVISRLAQGFGIQPHEIVQNFLSSDNTHFVEDQELSPLVYAEQFIDSEGNKEKTPEECLSRARMILSTELGKDPSLRKEIRELFKSDGRILVLPTDRGISKIDEHHPYYNFKYLYHKDVKDMLESAQFLHILAAEAENLVTASIFLPPDAKSMFERRLNEAFASDSFSDTAKAWNEERSLVVQETLEQHLIPVGVKWTREWIREEVEDYLAARCGGHLRSRIDVAPFVTLDMRPGDTASVLAMSWGKGDPQKDAISLVFLDEAGRLREHSKIDNLVDPESREEFLDLVKRRKPDVLVIGGFSMATTKLAQLVKNCFGEGASASGDNSTGGAWGGENRDTNEQAFNIPVIYVLDDVARIYQHSKRAASEFSALSPIAKYCVGLARYTQSPLNEFAALGADIAAISFDEDDQHLVPKEKLLTAFERVIVDVTNKVGVDVNRAVTDAYYQHLLPFVCGLGPRKAQVVVKKIAAIGGNLVNRDQFVKVGILTTKIFLNAAGFLRICHEPEAKPSKNRHTLDDVQDPLDNTRIHPEDYDLARKMATDALELDEEDVHDEHPSYVVSLIMQDDDNEKKLSELNLDEFAISMFDANEDRKRHTLNVIRDELLRPFAEQRNPFPVLKPWDVLTMLSGETQRTLRIGYIISVLIVSLKPNFAYVRLDSGIDGVINAQYLTDQGTILPENVVRRGQTIPGVIIDIKLNLPQDQFLIELSSRPTDVAIGDSLFRRVKHDEAWNHPKSERDAELQARKKRAEVDRTRRVVKHPNFHNYNTAQAEAYLEKQQRGDVVIRPSSKGIDHLAVTWKVDDKLYQHIDVTEPNADPTGQTIGSQLIVDGTHNYADLDELIVNHVQAMARRVEELMAHEKFKHGTEDDLHLFLKNFVAANPAKSMYGFTLNRKRPGHFSLCFLANKNSAVQSWPVRVAPEAYYLFEAAAVGVPELCDAFKVRHLHESQNLGGGGGRTPFGAGNRTPARTPGHVTPGRLSVRQLGRTPNPYGGSATPASRGAPTPGYVPQTPYGYQTTYGPRPPAGIPPQPPVVPPGMNPDRAAMIQSSGGWGGSGGGQW